MKNKGKTLIYLQDPGGTNFIKLNLKGLINKFDTIIVSHNLSAPILKSIEVIPDYEISSVVDQDFWLKFFKNNKIQIIYKLITRYEKVMIIDIYVCRIIYTWAITILSQIIFIDLVLAGDNAIIIGMVASKFPVEQRKKVIFWGIGGAVILRIILTMLTAYLLQITGLRLIGGLLLLYIVYKLYTDVIKGQSNEEDIKVDNSSFMKAIWTVLLADFTMSLDNVLGVAGAAGDHYTLLIFGLVLSIVLMATAANLISGWIKKYKWIAWAGLLAILVVAVELIYTDIKILFL